MTSAKTYTLTFTAQEVDLIGAALGELPAKHSHVLLHKLIDQVRMAKASAPKEPADDNG